MRLNLNLITKYTTTTTFLLLIFLMTQPKPLMSLEDLIEIDPLADPNNGSPLSSHPLCYCQDPVDYGSCVDSVVSCEFGCINYTKGGMHIKRCADEDLIKGRQLHRSEHACVYIGKDAVETNVYESDCRPFGVVVEIKIKNKTHSNSTASSGKPPNVTIKPFPYQLPVPIPPIGPGGPIVPGGPISPGGPKPPAVPGANPASTGKPPSSKGTTKAPSPPKYWKYHVLQEGCKEYEPHVWFSNLGLICLCHETYCNGKPPFNLAPILRMDPTAKIINSMIPILFTFLLQYVVMY